MLAGVHTAMQDAQHQNASGSRAVVNCVRNAFIAPQVVPNEAVVGAEARVVSRDGHFPVEGFCIPLRLGVAEVFDAVQVDVDQVPFGVEREFNFRHEVGPSAVLLRGRPVTLHRLIFR